MIIGVLFAILTMIGYGLSDFFIALAVKKTNPIKTFFLEMVFTVIVLIPFCFFWLNIDEFTIKIGIIILVESVIGVVSFLGFLKALEIGKVSILTPLSSTYSIVIIVIMIVFFNESLKVNQIFGISICILGTIFASLHHKDLIKFKITALTKGINYLLLAIFGWGIYFVLYDYLIEQMNWFTVAFLLNISFFIILLIIMLITKNNFKFTVSESKPIFASTIASIIALFGLTFAFKTALTSIVSPIIAAAPVVTLLLARIFFKEKLEIIQKIALIAVIIGIVLTSI